ncbi:MAG: hypothetical protein H6849_04265 [Alphaproteobacteria bacterium]|nr:MAG: hypothetical protein H6849_04265 [Alphaproteobacteria bacterium]
MFVQEDILSKRKVFGTFRMFVGRLIEYFYGPYIKMKRDAEINNVYISRYPGNLLNQAQVDELESYQCDTIELDSRRSFFESNHKDGTLENTFYGSIIPLVRKVIKTGSVSKVLNIGCSYDYPDCVLAEEFGEVNFLGIDFPRNIEQINHGLTRNNFKVKSGYALNLLKNKNIQSDLTYFSSTANNIRNAELQEYIKELSTVSKNIIFNEPFWLQPHKDKNPKALDSEASEVGHIYYDKLTGKIGYVSYNHNYAGLLERCGYKVTYYKTFKTDTFIDSIQMGRIQVIAEKI